MTVPSDALWSARELHALADEIARVVGADLPVDLLDQLDALERIKSAAAAAQVAITAALADAVTAEDDSPAVAADRRRRTPRMASIGAEVALAVRTSPFRGEQRVLLSRRLRDDLPGVHAALARGEVDERQAFAVAREVAHLDPDQRRLVDADLAIGGVAGLGEERLRRDVRRSCLTVAADAEAGRHDRARADRHVTTRQLDDGTGRLTAVLPIEDLAAVRAVLDRAAAEARSQGDDRAGSQVRADTLVGRVTGLDHATPPPVRVNLTIGVESLLGGSTEPGLVDGLGWLPATLCRDLVRRASAVSRAALRRLFADPADRALVAMESRSRAFPTALGELLEVRDGGICRTPGCSSPIRHHDHVTPAAEGGRTSADNGQGLCERCNYVKETPGWTSWVVPDPGSGRHEVHGVTEHLRILRSTAPPLPGGPGARHGEHSPDSPGELHVRRALTLAA